MGQKARIEPLGLDFVYTFTNCIWEQPLEVLGYSGWGAGGATVTCLEKESGMELVVLTYLYPFTVPFRHSFLTSPSPYPSIHTLWYP